MWNFQFIALTPSGLVDSAVAIAASRAGEVGVLNLEYTPDTLAVDQAIADLARYTDQRCGLKLNSNAIDMILDLVASGMLPDQVGLMILTPGQIDNLSRVVQALRQRELTILLEVTDAEQAAVAGQLGLDGLIAKGNEAGGWVGEETTFILLQRLLAKFDLPVWAYGGIGLHTVAACYAAGAAGVVLDSQLALTRESPLPDAVKTAIAAMDGSETFCLSAEIGQSFRTYHRPDPNAAQALAEKAVGLANEAEQVRWREAVEAKVGWGALAETIWPLGQDAAFAASLANRYATVGGILAAMRQALETHLQTAIQERPLDTESPLAQAHNTRYPIVQGPMTRVSDRAEFALRVAEGGGLPFLALALMRALEVEALLTETRELLGDRSWGVGILGFVPLALREEQLAVIRKIAPPFAIIAGGRPDQARSLEADGIATYLHVPSPGLLRLFLRDGARRFIFEGRECGGHVGPRSSFVLWNSMIEVILEELPEAEAQKCFVLFAGGIHDSRSGAMVAAMAAPLIQRGVRIGVLMGTAYLFTQEAVATGSIVPGFQAEALSCHKTALIESGPGHATRCVPTQFIDIFHEEKTRLQRAGKSSEEIRFALEELNVGRLRIASKGITRHPDYAHDPAAPKYITLTEEDQHREGMYMIGQLAALRDQTCTIEDLHREVTVESVRLLDRFVEDARQGAKAAGEQGSRGAGERGNFTPAPLHLRTPAHATRDARQGANPSQIAIIGISTLLPKAKNLNEFWDNIFNGVNAITEVPPDRWDADLYYDSDRNARDKIYSKAGGFLDEIPFDPIEFGIPPNSLPSIDPMHLLALVAARDALADAGYGSRPFDRSRTSVILGASGGTGDLGANYLLRAGLPHLFGQAGFDIAAQADGLLPEWTEDSFAGLLLNVTAGRIANRFDFGGLNYVVDAACASSLAAVHLAVKELETGNTDLVLTGGVDTVQNPFGYLCFSKTQALSPSGKPRVFDADGDGIVISEGVVMLVLKRLADAERDGDCIYAVISAVGGSSDGRAMGMTAPRAEGQALALTRAYEKAGFSPTTIGLFEAHGTGTVVGDRTEATALADFLKSEGAQPQSHAIGSIKSMIGHTKATAGVAGIAKIASALYHKVLPPTLGVSQPNPKAGFGDGPLFVNAETRPWIHGMQNHPRRAGVSAFGFGGTNFHAVLEEYTGDFLTNRRRAVLQRWPSELLLWSAPTWPDLLNRLNSLIDAIARGAKPELVDLAYTLWKAYPKATNNIRLAIIASSVDDLARKLKLVCKALPEDRPAQLHDPSGIFLASEKPDNPGQIAFLFPGQGSQYPNMLRDLSIHFPEVRGTIERFDRVLSERLPRPLSSYIFPPPAFSPEEKQAQQKALTQTHIAQPAMGAANMALVELLRILGIQPDLVAGHSYGEYVALCAAGAIDLETLATLSEARGQVIVEAANRKTGTMAAVWSDANTIAPIIDALTDVWVANLNAPNQTIISGTEAGISAALKHLRGQNITTRIIPVACAFHSPLMAPAQAHLEKILSQLTFAEPKVKLYANTTAALYPSRSQEIQTLLAEHLCQPVRFADQIEAMYTAGARLFVEAGPGQVLTGLTKQILINRPHLALAVDAPNQHGLTQLQTLLAQLAVQGVPIQLDRLFEGRETKQLNLDVLIQETNQKPLPPTTWVVNGSRARPLKAAEVSGKTKPAKRPLLHLATEHANGEATNPDFNLTAEPPATPQTSAANSVPVQPASSHAVLAQANGEVEQVMLQFQQSMQKFLETQHQVMMAYLQGSGQKLVDNDAAPSFETPSPVQWADQPPTQSQLNTETNNSFAPNSAAAEAAGVSADGEVKFTEDAEASEPQLSSLNREQLTQQLLQIVSDRTGYPVEMLDLDVDIEANLGIDSIKRVEILGLWQRDCLPSDRQISEGAMEELTRVKTLRGVIDWLDTTLTPDKDVVQSVPWQDDIAAPETETPSPETADPTESSEIPRSILTAVDAPPIEAPITFNPERIFLITADNRGHAATLARQIANQGGRAVLIGPEAISETADLTAIQADLTDVTAVRNLVASVRQEHGPVGGLIHLLPLVEGVDFESLDLSGWQAGLRRQVKSLFYLAQAVSADLKQAAEAGPAWLIAATSVAAGQTIAPDQAGIAGLIKTLAQEWPQVTCKVVHLDSKEADSVVAKRLLQEMVAHDQLAEVTYQATQRYVYQPILSPLDEHTSPQLTPDSDWVMLLTGGARGITAEVALDLAEHYRPTLHLIGTSPIPPVEEAAHTAGLTSAQSLKAALMKQMRQNGEPVTLARVEAVYHQLLKEREMRHNLARMRQTGATVHYHQVDVRDEAAMIRLLDTIYHQRDRLDCVVHGAGVIEDKLIEEKSPQSFERVFNTKADSAFILSRLLKSDSLKFLAFFSSAAGSFGNPGQSDYAAANEVLNKLARHLDQMWPGRVVSLNWGPWLKTGMVSAELQRQFARRKIQVIPIQEGCRLFAQELRYGRKGEVEVVLAGGRWGAGDATSKSEPAAATLAKPRPLAIHQNGISLNHTDLPLLQQAHITTGTNGMVEVTRRLDPSVDLYLQDHQLDGKQVFPLAMAMELMAEVVQHGWSDLNVVGLKDLQVLKGVVLDEGPQTIKVTAKAHVEPLHEQAGIHVQITDQSQTRTYYRATVELAASLLDLASYTPPVRNGLQPFPMPLQEAYDHWLFHGPLFQGITAIEGISPELLIAHCRPSLPQTCLSSNPAGQWLIDPVVFDSALQMIILWTRYYTDKTPLPARFNRYRRFGSLSASPIHCYLHVPPLAQTGMFAVDIAFVNQAGQLVGLLEGMECPASKALNRLVGSHGHD